MIDLTVHLLLFVVGGVVLVLAPLLIGKLLRPAVPTREKDAVYECGEPTIGSSYVQFDIRFYVVALLFIIFDVELAFFFPWALIFGGAAQLADPNLSSPARSHLTDKLLSLPAGTTTPETALAAADASRLAWIGFFDILVFFGVLLVGFAYVWKRGDLDWVRALVAQAKESAARSKVPATAETTRRPQPVA
jgi:NADH-quinone oxidoreductase subunit A